MDRETMVSLLEQGADPVLVAIGKWENILNKTGEDERSSNCALCYVYEGCNECPFSAKARGEEEVSNCHETYANWTRHHNEKHSPPHFFTAIKCEECEALAKNILAALKELKYKED